MTGSFFTGPDYGGREPSRPRAVNPRTGKEQSWTRPSTFASALDDPYGLMKRDGRNIVMGMSRRPDLARMALTGATADDVTKVDETIKTAKEVMASSANANLGTAAHAAITRAWQHPDQPVPEEYVPLVAAFAAALKEHGLTIYAAAQKILNLTYNSKGELDFVLQESDGSLVIGDAKSGNLEHAKRKFAVQLAMYDGAEYWLDGKDVATEAPKLAHNHGVIIHLDLEHNAVSLYRVDLRIGRYGAGLAEQIRQWHTLDPLTPYVSPVTPRAVRQGVVSADAVGLRHTEVTATEAATQIPGKAIPLTPEEYAAGPDKAELINQAIEDAGGAPEQSAGARFDELMKLEKAALQMLLKGLGWSDLAHNRRWLARALVAKEQGFADAAVKKYAAAKDDEAPITKGLAQVAQVLQENAGPVSNGPSTSALLEAIAGANGMGALRALQADVVERHGDQAWTDELAEAVRQRAQQFAAQQHIEARSSLFEEIAAAPTQQALKDIWERVTIGSSVPENWTEDLALAGVQRLEQIKAATTPPPANPFA